MHAFARFVAVAVCAAAAASAAQAQTQRLSPGPAATPSASARAATATPNPAGLRPQFPAGITSGSGAAQSSDPIAASTAPVPANSAGTGSTGVAGGGGAVIPSELPPSGAAPDTTVLGAGGPGVPGPAQPRLGGGAGGFAAADTARSFFFADANHDGELTRAEARRLSIATQSFEEMDRNFDQVISRFEYDDSLR